MSVEPRVAIRRIEIVQDRNVLIGEDQLMKGGMFDRNDGLTWWLLGKGKRMCGQEQATSNCAYELDKACHLHLFPFVLALPIPQPSECCDESNVSLVKTDPERACARASRRKGTISLRALQSMRSFGTSLRRR
jgi:hypothetical protein